MEKTYLENRYTSLTYTLKEGTKASYYLTEGKKNLLPNRISVGDFSAFAPSKVKNKVAELKGNYNKSEEGKFKGLNKGNSVHTSIYPIDLRYNFKGYGILDERHKIYDLLVLENKEPNSIVIHYFEDMGRPEYKQTVWNYLKGLFKK